MAGWAIASWSEVDIWCLERGLDPLEIPVQRFFNLIRHILFDGLTEESKKEIQHTLNEAARLGHPWLNKETEKTKPNNGWTVDEKGRKKPPPGWTPPGWVDDKTAYRRAKEAMKKL